MSNSTQPSILCPLPRRTHSNPIHNTNKPSMATRNNQKKLGQEPTSSADDVLSEFLSLFTPPSEPNRQSILIYNNHLDSSIQPQNQSKSSSQPTSPIRTTTSTPLSSSSSLSPPPSARPTLDQSNQLIAQPYRLQPTDYPEHVHPQVGLAVAPNHLSSIVSSPISRCHNPLPRHAELDVLASRLTKPFESFALGQDHPSLNVEDEQPPPEESQSDHLPSDLMPALT